MTARRREDRCPACGSNEVQPFAIIVGAAETYGYQCLACSVTWTVMQTATPPDPRAVRSALQGGWMSVPALALAPVLIDPGTGTGANVRTLNDELLDRAARDDYHAWLAGTAAAGGCVRPIRLHGTIRDINPATGEVLRTLDTDDAAGQGDLHPVRGPPRLGLPRLRRDLPRRHLPAHPRRAHRRQRHPRVGAHPPVRVRHLHRPLLRPRPHPPSAARRPGRPLPPPPQGRPAARTGGGCPAASATKTPTPAWAGRCARTATTTPPPSCGTPTPPSCGGAPPSPSAASSPRPPAPHGAGKVQLSYAKVAEFQARGLIHFHAIFRLDGHRPADGRARPARRSAPSSCSTPSAGRHRLDLVRHRPPPRQAGRLGHPLGRPARHPHRPAARRRRPGHRHRGRLLPGQVRHQVHRGGRHRRQPDHRC